MVGKDVYKVNYFLYTTAFQYDMEVQSETNTCIDLSEIFCFQLEFGSIGIWLSTICEDPHVM